MAHHACANFICRFGFPRHNFERNAEAILDRGFLAPNNGSAVRFFEARAGVFLGSVKQ